MDSDYEDNEYLSDVESDADYDVPEYDMPDFKPEYKKVCNFCKHANVETSKKCDLCGRCGTHAVVSQYMLQSCMHEFCRDCLVNYFLTNEKLEWILAYNVNDEKFNGFTCPLPECRKRLGRQDVRAVVGQYVLGFLDDQALQQVNKAESPYVWVHRAAMNLKVSFDSFKSASQAGKTQKTADEILVRALKAMTECISQVSDQDAYLLEVVACCDPTLNDVLRLLLRNDSTLDISERSNLYAEMFNFFTVATGKPRLYPLLHTQEGNKDCWMQDLVTMDQESLMYLFEKLHKQATFILSNHVATANLSPKEVEFLSKSKSVYEVLNEHVRVWKSEVATHAWYKDAHRYFTERWRGILPSFGETDAASTSSGKTVGEKVDYVNALKPKQFAEANLIDRHYFRKQLENFAENKARSRRVAKEIATLATTLPLEYHSSIHIRVHEDRLDIIKALIVGPEGTPYENGIFLFDILLTPEYPLKPPSVQYLTTGNGKIRFNPNLYNCGKVCLSLLGTWTGPSWEPNVSTLLQVLVSIQSLVLVPDPYYNEPGNEMHERNKGACEAYNREQKYNTLVYSMLPALREPEPAFADVIRLHFKLKRQTIEEQCDRWMEESLCYLGRRITSEDAVKAVKAELAKL